MGVCVCLSVCPRGCLRNHIHAIFTIFVHIACGRGSVFIRRRCDTLCISGFVNVNDIMFFIMGHIGYKFRYEGPISLKFTYLP